MNIKKVRKGNENIAKLIMFSITIIIATGLLAILVYFYNKHKEYEINISLFGNIHVGPNELNKLDTITGCTTTPNYSITDDKYWVKGCNIVGLENLDGIYDVKKIGDKIYYKIGKN